jgi:hypothetical protein
VTEKCETALKSLFDEFYRLSSGSTMKSVGSLKPGAVVAGKNPSPRISGGDTRQTGNASKLTSAASSKPATSGMTTGAKTTS